MPEIHKTEKIKAISYFILDVALLLTTSGGNAKRVKTNTSRMAKSWGYILNINIGLKNTIVSLRKDDNPNIEFTVFKENEPMLVNFSVLSKISKLSWSVYEDNKSFEETLCNFNEIKAEKPPYSKFVTGIAVSLACAGVCMVSNGDILNVIVTFIATICGFTTKFFLEKNKFNFIINIVSSSFITSLVACIAYRYNIGSHPESAIATSVLYLIPGVPLLNAVMDMMGGYMHVAMERFLFTIYWLFCIGIGITISIFLLGVTNF